VAAAEEIMMVIQFFTGAKNQARKRISISPHVRVIAGALLLVLQNGALHNSLDRKKYERPQPHQRTGWLLAHCQAIFL
jgi:hypothetical protein